MAPPTLLITRIYLSVSKADSFSSKEIFGWAISGGSLPLATVGAGPCAGVASGAVVLRAGFAMKYWKDTIIKIDSAMATINLFSIFLPLCRVVSAAGERVTADYSFYAFKNAFDNTVFANGVRGVFRTGRIKSAAL